MYPRIANSRQHRKMPQMSTVCCIVSLIIVAVLVQNASGKRGCASFGHACYGGHGKRSSPTGGILPEGFDGTQGLALESMPPPLPYVKALQMDRSRGGGYEVVGSEGGTFLRPVGLMDLIAGREQGSFAGSRAVAASQQDRFEQTVRLAVNAVLRQMLEENRLQRDQQEVGESGQNQQQQQQPHHPQMDSEQN